MNLFTFIFDSFAGVGLYFYEVISGFMKWLGLHDFSGKKRRERYLVGAPESFANDHLPVVIGADDHYTFLYNENGYVLQDRRTKIATPVPRKFHRRFIQKDMKALHTLAL